jgi:hypothetical protein
LQLRLDHNQQAHSVHPCTRLFARPKWCHINMELQPPRVIECFTQVHLTSTAGKPGGKNRPLYTGDAPCFHLYFMEKSLYIYIPIIMLHSSIKPQIINMLKTKTPQILVGDFFYNFLMQTLLEDQVLMAYTFCIEGPTQTFLGSRQKLL